MAERELHAVAALASGAGSGPVDYDTIDLKERMPTVQEVKDAAASVGVTLPVSDSDIQGSINGAAAMSLPGGRLYVPSNSRSTQNRLDSLIAHEIEHQAQYQNVDPKDIFSQLISESQTNGAAYITPGTLEYAAQQVENKANELLNNGWKPSLIKPNDESNGMKNK